jgi:hypothetical protein
VEKRSGRDGDMWPNQRDLAGSINGMRRFVSI